MARGWTRKLRLGIRNETSTTDTLQTVDDPGTDNSDVIATATAETNELQDDVSDITADVTADVNEPQTVGNVDGHWDITTVEDDMVDDLNAVDIWAA